MPFSNLIQTHFDAPERQQAFDLINNLRALIIPKSHNLNPEERQKYGSIHEKNKLFVGKVIEYNQSQPHLSSPDVKWQDMDSDWADHSFLEQLLRMIEEVAEIAKDTKTLHDYDLYQNALTDYDFVKYRKDIDTGAGFETKYNDLKQFMSPGPGKNSASPNNENIDPTDDSSI